MFNLMTYCFWNNPNFPQRRQLHLYLWNCINCLAQIFLNFLILIYLYYDDSKINFFEMYKLMTCCFWNNTNFWKRKQLNLYLWNCINCLAHIYHKILSLMFSYYDDLTIILFTVYNLMTYCFWKNPNIPQRRQLHLYLWNFVDFLAQTYLNH